MEVGNNSSISITWTDARTKCLEQQGDLASVPDRETLEFLNKLGGNRVSHWIGGQQKDGRWTWTDGTPWSNEFWMPGEPNNEGETIGGIKRNQTAINLWKSGQWDDKASEYLNSGYFCQTARNFKTRGNSFELLRCEFSRWLCFVANCPSHKNDKIGSFKITLKESDREIEFEGSSSEQTFLWTKEVPVGKYEVMVQSEFGLLPFDKVSYKHFDTFT